MMLVEGDASGYKDAFDKFVDALNEAACKVANDNGLSLMLCPCCNMPLTCTETAREIKCTIVIVKPTTWLS
jgi:7-cyano-7-deazaguanine synthase in queuosine biosynthesis